MKKVSIKAFAFLLPFYLIFSVGCPQDPNSEPNRIKTNEQSVVPSETESNQNQVFGCVETSKRKSLIKVWGNPPTNDLNFSLLYSAYSPSSSFSVFSNKTLKPEENADSKTITFKSNGFNYLIFRANDPQNVYNKIHATISIDGVEQEVFATPDSNGCVDVVVTGFGVNCPSTGMDLGSAHFWSLQMPDCGSYTVEVDGYGSSQVTGAFGETPDCSDASNGGLFEDLPVGTYNYSISDCPDVNTTGTFDVTQDGCSAIEIAASGGSGSGTGDLIFWTDALLDSGPFTVTVDGVGSQQVTGYFSNVPDCSDASQGGLFEDLPVGTYSFTISDFPSANGTYNITVVEDQCTQVDFNL